MAIQTRSNKQFEKAEIHGTNDQIIIPFLKNILIVLSPSSPKLSKTPTKTEIPSTDMTYLQHKIDALRPEIEKNAAGNNELKNLVKKTLTKERIHKREEAEILYEKLRFLKKKANVLKLRLAVVEMLITGDKCKKGMESSKK